MQLRIAHPLANKAISSGFKYGLSALLSGLTVVGSFSTVILNSSIAKEKLDEATKSITNIFEGSVFYEGIKNLGGTIKDWGVTVINTKDDFKNWLDRYLGPSGFKSGVVELYEKLVSWVTIVYEWFRDKFLEFIQNIPKMVENWRKLRLSLFKWGTFLGGGGGSALWGMFASGDNWGRLAELMGNPDFTGAVEKFGELVENNPNAFGEMGEEAMKEIIEKIMEDPNEAKEIAEELLKEQQEQNKDKKEGEKMEELKDEKIKEAYSNKKGGKPKDTQQALGDLIASGLNQILSEKSAFKDPFSVAKDAMKKHIEHLEKESQGSSEDAKIKKEFLAAINNSKDSLINTFATLSRSAYEIYNAYPNGNEKSERLAKIFENLMKEEFTQEVNGEEEGDAKLEGIITLKNSK